MKKFLVLLIILIGGFVAALNLHIIRTDNGFEYTTKEHMTLEDTYVDVRDWSLIEYFRHSPKIRDYLLFERHEKSLTEKIEKEKKHLESAEKSVKDWFSEHFDKK